MYGIPGLTPQPKPLDHCNVTDCKHHIPYFPSHIKGPLPQNYRELRCQCSSTKEGRTGEPGCIGHKDKYVQERKVAESVG